MTQQTYSLTPSDFAAAVKAAEEQKNFTPPPPGEYVAVIKDAKFAFDQKNQPYAFILFRIEEGQYEGRSIGRRYYVATKNPETGAPIGIGQFFGLWSDAGLSTDSLQGADLVKETPKLVGCKLTIVIKSRKDKNDPDKTYTDVNHTKPFVAEPASASVDFA
jgi:hypothetical protein